MRLFREAIVILAMLMLLFIGTGIVRAMHVSNMKYSHVTLLEKTMLNKRSLFFEQIDYV